MTLFSLPGSLVICPFASRRRRARGLSLSWRCAGPSEPPPGAQKVEYGGGASGGEASGAVDRNPKGSRVFALPARGGETSPRGCCLCAGLGARAHPAAGGDSLPTGSDRPPSLRETGLSLPGPEADVPATVVTGCELMRWCGQAAL